MIAYHIVNKLEWGGYKHFKHCAHEPYTMEESRGREWLQEGSDAHKAIVSISKNKKFKGDCKYLTKAIHTTNVEVFNNIILKYLQKQYHFEYDHMVMGPTFFFFNWDSPHPSLNSHYKACSYKKKKHKEDYRIQKICLERTYS